ncbi:MAG: protein phosphatase 2C domain-containing protein [Actinomycetota bacterium]
MSTFTIETAGVTDTGNVRPSNEDHYLAGGDLFAVADGMGGLGNGERASRLAIETLQEAFAEQPTAVGLVEAVARANTAVNEAAATEAGPDERPWGTTLAAVARVGSDDDDRLVVVNVGDSRVYLHRDGALTRLSSDHSRVADLVRAGEISEAEAAAHPERHVLTLALGVSASVAPSVNHVRPRPGDRLLLCSDGLFNEVPSGDIAAALGSDGRPSDVADGLVAQAKANGGGDNVTVVVADVG